MAFFNSINSVNEKKGCLLIQFPPSIGREYTRQLEKLLSCIIESDPAQNWKVAVEFRNRSRYDEDIYDLLNFYKAAIVIQDIPKSATPLLNHQSDFLYLRFHGPTGNYRESYSGDFLKEYAGFINEWIEERKTVYAYFNNTMGDAFNNLETLNRLVQVLTYRKKLRSNYHAYFKMFKGLDPHLEINEIMYLYNRLLECGEFL